MSKKQTKAPPPPADDEDKNPHDERKDQYRAEYKDLGLKDLALKMIEIESAKEKLESRLKEANAAYDVLRLELIPAKMEETGVENVRYDGIGQVVLTGDLYVRTIPGQKEGLFSWLKKHKLQALVQPSINASTLKAWVRQRIKEGKDYPTDFLKVEPFTRASIRKG